VGEHLNEKNGGARREFPVVGCEGGRVEKYQVWNGNGCGEILESPAAAVYTEFTPRFELLYGISSNLSVCACLCI
jgi:hypothetical protein